MSRTSSENNMSETVVLVTGASRGIGKGIARILVEAGATVYITGRKSTQQSLYPDVMETAAELNKLGKGKCIGIYCNHRDSKEIERLFEVIENQEKGLQILVNNVFGGLDLKKDLSQKRFWNLDPSLMWEKTMDCSLRSHYICSCLAIRIMEKQKSGLIVNISSEGGLWYLFSPLYGVGKEGTDRMAVDMGKILRQHNICVVSLWPGPTKTEVMKRISESENSTIVRRFFHAFEDVTLTGKTILHIYNDPNRMKHSGRVRVVSHLSNSYSIEDQNGNSTPMWMSLKQIVSMYYPSVAKYCPSFIRIPFWILTLYTSKF